MMMATSAQQNSAACSMRILACYRSCVDCVFTSQISRGNPICHAVSVDFHKAITAVSALYRQRSCTGHPPGSPASVKHVVAARSFTFTSRSLSTLAETRADIPARLARRMSDTAAKDSSHDQSKMKLGSKDESLVHLFLAASSHQWKALPGKNCHRLFCTKSKSSCKSVAPRCNAELGKACYDHGCSIVEVRGCIRHVVV